MLYLMLFSIASKSHPQGWICCYRIDCTELILLKILRNSEEIFWGFYIFCCRFWCCFVAFCCGFLVCSTMCRERSLQDLAEDKARTIKLLLVTKRSWDYPRMGGYWWNTLRWATGGLDPSWPYEHFACRKHQYIPCWPTTSTYYVSYMFYAWCRASLTIYSQNDRSSPTFLRKRIAGEIVGSRIEGFKRQQQHI
jgi:hypothetical protein